MYVAWLMIFQQKNTLAVISYKLRDLGLSSL